MVEPTPSKKQSETSLPIKTQPTELQTEMPLDNDLPVDRPRIKLKPQALARHETSLGDAWMPPAEGCCLNYTGKLPECAQLSLEDEEFENMIPIHAAAVFSDYQKDRIDDLKSHSAVTECLLTEKWIMATNTEIGPITQHQVLGDFVKLPE